MPSIFTHDTFGDEVLAKLPEKIQEYIRPYKTQFRIGLQGPDFLFFYHPLIKRRPNQLGHSQHRKPAANFFEKGLPLLREKGYNSPEYAYTIGFICHFMLDSECHTYVNEKAKQKGFNHLLMETEFDRFLMKKNHIDPFRFNIWDYVPRDNQTVKTIYHMYKPFGLSQKQIAAALRGMHFYKKLFTTGKSLKRLFVRLGMLITLRYRQLEGHMMSLLPKRSARITNPKLWSYFTGAIPKTVEIIQEFHDGLLDGAPLDKRFLCDFRSNHVN